MEIVRKVIFIFLIILVSLFTGCASKEAVAEDVLVLAEITPLPKDVQLKKKALYEPVYGVMRVLEITLENGVQAELMA